MGWFAGGGGGAPGAAVGAMPLGSAPSPPPAAPVGSAPVGSAPVGGPGVYAAAVKDASAPGGGAPAPIPVSAARAERDVIAQLSAAGAARRRGAGGGSDPLVVARRIALALNAPDRPGRGDANFYWVTALTVEGKIVVANSFGMAYMPDGVNLPDPVCLVSADAAVPVVERARWSTYPFAALQGWAAHQGARLRVVFATEEQFAGVDPGAPRQVLDPEEIPPSGAMAGRDRLQVVAPGEAARLAGVSDWNLVELLPLAPVDAAAPADRRAQLWWDVNKPMLGSGAPDRGLAQLRYLLAYAIHAAEMAVYEGYSAVHAVAQRKAVSDWLYWRYLRDLLSEALAGAAAR
ncbi:secretion protein EccK [Mycobacterium sp. SM1]|uniref:secretion protein EccK n=1 Tax=Mycobacterium sp. SM1 TaxID=2816243 RepID=UPI001BCE03A1|nr:secretion protein EccK [Mycobacterium sp. SM1]MBS4728042.1 secretion protein EccK [Mycobacterium sp. SM1]